MAWTHAILLLWPVATPPVEDDYDSHWHYAKQQKKRRQQAKALQPPAKDARPPTPFDVRMQIVSAVRATAVVGILPVTNVEVSNVVPGSILASYAQARAVPIVSVAAGGSVQTGVTSAARIRVVDVIAELRDLEDMIDLYELLMVT